MFHLLPQSTTSLAESLVGVSHVTIGKKKNQQQLNTTTSIPGPYLRETAYEMSRKSRNIDLDLCSVTVDALSVYRTCSLFFCRRIRYRHLSKSFWFSPKKKREKYQRQTLVSPSSRKSCYNPRSMRVQEGIKVAPTPVSAVSLVFVQKRHHRAFPRRAFFPPSPRCLGSQRQGQSESAAAANYIESHAAGIRDLTLSPAPLVIAFVVVSFRFSCRCPEGTKADKSAKPPMNMGHVDRL